MSPENLNETNGKIFLTGGTGYIGRHLVNELLLRNMEVYALTRRASNDFPDACHVLFGDALNRNTFQGNLKSVDTFVHLVGVSHPGPLKTELFRSIDLRSVQEAVAAAVAAKIRHFVYVSVAHPAPVMKAYWQVRQQCEAIIRDSGLDATIVRPWYVLGPGHWWPYFLVPFYRIFAKIPGTAESCRRLGLVKLGEMIAALSFAVATPVQGVRIIDVPRIREIARQGMLI